jgi:hypothetical protein
MMMEQNEFFTYSEGFGQGSPSAFSNLFRFKLLSESGGWWVDTDVICLSGHIPSCERFFALQGPEVANTAIMYFEPQDSIMLRCFEQARSAGKRVLWGQTGPKLLTKVLRELDLLHLAHESRVCYPVGYHEIPDMLRPARRDYILKTIEGSPFCHLWNSGVRQLRISKTSLPPRGSWLRDLVEQYRVEGWEGEYTSDVLESVVELYRLRSELNQLQEANEKLRLQLNEPKVEQGDSSEVRELRNTNERLLRLCHDQRRTIEQIDSSMSWRITAPLREARRLLRRRLS